MHYQSVNPCRVLSSPSFLFHLLKSSSLSSSVSLSVSLCLCLRVVLQSCCCLVVCCVVWCVLLCDACHHLFMFGNGFPSRFVHFSFVASLSFRVWPADLHRNTGAGLQSPVGQTELIIGIRDVHNEVSAWTSRTTLRWWTTSKTTCSTAQVSVRHLAG